jgi:hypothetical protein
MDSTRGACHSALSMDRLLAPGRSCGSGQSPRSSDRLVAPGRRCGLDTWGSSFSTVHGPFASLAPPSSFEGVIVVVYTALRV